MNENRVLELALEQINDQQLELLQLRAMLENREQRIKKLEIHEHNVSYYERSTKEAHAATYRWEQRALTAESVVEERERQREKWRVRADEAEVRVKELEQEVEIATQLAIERGEKARELLEIAAEEDEHIESLSAELLAMLDREEQRAVELGESKEQIKEMQKWLLCENCEEPATYYGHSLLCAECG